MCINRDCAELFRRDDLLTVKCKLLDHFAKTTSSFSKYSDHFVTLLFMHNKSAYLDLIVDQPHRSPKVRLPIALSRAFDSCTATESDPSSFARMNRSMHMQCRSLSSPSTTDKIAASRWRTVRFPKGHRG